jgi:hypothetical protein
MWEVIHREVYVTMRRKSYVGVIWEVYVTKGGIVAESLSRKLCRRLLVNKKSNPEKECKR